MEHTRQLPPLPTTPEGFHSFDFGSFGPVDYQTTILEMTQNQAQLSRFIKNCGVAAANYDKKDLDDEQAIRVYAWRLLRPTMHAVGNWLDQHGQPRDQEFGSQLGVVLQHIDDLAQTYFGACQNNPSLTDPEQLSNEWQLSALVDQIMLQSRVDFSFSGHVAARGWVGGIAVTSATNRHS